MSTAAKTIPCRDGLSKRVQAERAYVRDSLVAAARNGTLKSGDAVRLTLNGTERNSRFRGLVVNGAFKRISSKRGCVQLHCSIDDAEDSDDYDPWQVFPKDGSDMDPIANKDRTFRQHQRVLVARQEPTDYDWIPETVWTAATVVRTPDADADKVLVLLDKTLLGKARRKLVPKDSVRPMLFISDERPAEEAMVGGVVSVATAAPPRRIPVHFATRVYIEAECAKDSGCKRPLTDGKEDADAADLNPAAHKCAFVAEKDLVADEEQGHAELEEDRAVDTPTTVRKRSRSSDQVEDSNGVVYDPAAETPACFELEVSPVLTKRFAPEPSPFSESTRTPSDNRLQRVVPNSLPLVLDKDHFATLQSGNEIIDSVLIAYAELLQRDCKDAGKHFVSVDKTTLLLKGREKVLQSLPSSDATKLIMPAVLVENDQPHYVLLVADRRQRIVSVYDSLSVSQDCTRSALAPLLNVFSQASAGLPFSLQFSPCPKQTNAVDCGVFVLAAMRCIFEGFDPNYRNVAFHLDAFTRFARGAKISTMRKHVCKELKRSKLLNIKSISKPNTAKTSFIVDDLDDEQQEFEEKLLTFLDN